LENSLTSSQSGVSFYAPLCISMNLSMVVAGGGVQMSVTVGVESASDGVRLGQRDVVSFEMLLQTGQLPERFRAALHHTPVWSITCNRYH